MTKNWKRYYDNILQTHKPLDAIATSRQIEFLRSYNAWLKEHNKEWVDANCSPILQQLLKLDIFVDNVCYYVDYLKRPPIEDYQAFQREYKWFELYICEKCRRNFRFFCIFFFDILKPSERLIVDLFADLQMLVMPAFKDGNLKEGDASLAVNCPMRMGKTIIMNQLFAVWCWVEYPERNIIEMSAAVNTVEGFLLEMRNMMMSELFQYVFINVGRDNGLRLKKKTKHTLMNVAGGTIKARSISAQFGGLSADIIICDDFNKTTGNTAHSFDNAIHTYAYLCSRLTATNSADENKKRALPMVLLGQRVSKKDIFGYIYDFQKKTTKIKLNKVVIPFETFEDGDVVVEFKDGNDVKFPRPRGWLRKYHGSTLSIKEEEVEKAKLMGTYLPNYQQDVEHDCGIGLDLKYSECFSKEKPITFDRFFFTTDLAFTEEKYSNHTCFCFWGAYMSSERRPQLYLLDFFYRKIDALEIIPHLDNFVTENLMHNMASLRKYMPYLTNVDPDVALLYEPSSEAFLSEYLLTGRWRTHENCDSQSSRLDWACRHGATNKPEITNCLKTFIPPRKQKENSKANRIANAVISLYSDVDMYILVSKQEEPIRGVATGKQQEYLGDIVKTKYYYLQSFYKECENYDKGNSKNNDDDFLDNLADAVAFLKY